MTNSPIRTPFRTHEEVLEALVDEVSLSETVLDKVQSRYEAIAGHLDRATSTIKHLAPHVYPQGSINLGTANQPLSQDDEIDVDIVTELGGGDKSQFSQAELKNKVAYEVAEYARIQGMVRPEDGKRCVTLTYRDGENGGYGFHVDILPAIVDETGYRAILESSDRAYAEEDITGAIAITCKEHPNYFEINDDWPVSNPKGYARWFESRQSVVLSEQRESLVKNNVAASVEDIPLFRVNTPLQNVIKLLKRDRDSTIGDDDDKPISIIITTLAAHAYQGETNLVDAMKNVLLRMDQFIGSGSFGEYSILNPVNPAENFADRWGDNLKAEKFFEWLENVRDTYSRFFAQPIGQSRKILAASISENAFIGVAGRLPVSSRSPDALLLRMRSDEDNHRVDTDRLLELIHFGIDEKVDWSIISSFAQKNYDFSDQGMHEDIAKINFYQVHRHRGLVLNAEAVADIKSVMTRNADSAAFKMCGNLLLGTATRQMIKDAMLSNHRLDVLSWPITRLATGQI